MSEYDVVCNALIDLQVRRKFVLATEIMCLNSSTAFTSRICGFETTDDEESRAKKWARGTVIVKTALSGKPQKPEDIEVVDEVAAELGMLKQMFKPLLERRSEIEKEMRRLAAMLPVKTKIAGFDLLGLAVIVGEAGNLSNYTTVRKLWRRLGFGMAPGHEAKAYSTWRREGGLSAEDWINAGYSPRRLGQVYGVVTVPLFMSKAKNKYGEIYANRRAHTAVTHPDWTKAHSDNDARRVMTKALISDLWSEWRRSKSSMAKPGSPWSTPQLIEIAA